MKSRVDASDFDGQEVTAEQLGSVLEITARRVRELAEGGIFPRKGRGRYALGPSIRAYITSLKQRAVRDSDAELERRLLAAKAEKAELEVAQIKGDLRDVASTERVVQEWTRTERSNLNALPAQYADTMAAELGVEVAAVITALDGMVRHHLTRESQRAFTLALKMDKAS